MTRFLIDNALSPDVARALASRGYDAVHVRDYGMAAASDDVIFDRASQEDRVVVSSDTDFGVLLASRMATKPSVILFRGVIARRPSVQADVLVANLPALEADLARGACVTFKEGALRVRLLPLMRVAGA